MDKARKLDLMLQVLRETKANHQRMREEWAEGARLSYAEGFRPHYCIHGTNQWTDYDNICGACENYGYNGLPNPYEVAVATVRQAEREAQARRELALPVLYMMDHRRDQGLRDALLEWTWAPIVEVVP